MTSFRVDPAVDAWRAKRDMFARSLKRAGMDPEEFREMLRNSERIEELVFFLDTDNVFDFTGWACRGRMIKCDHSQGSKLVEECEKKWAEGGKILREEWE